MYQFRLEMTSKMNSMEENYKPIDNVEVTTSCGATRVKITYEMT